MLPIRKYQGGSQKIEEGALLAEWKIELFLGLVIIWIWGLEIDGHCFRQDPLIHIGESPRW